MAFKTNIADGPLCDFTTLFCFHVASEASSDIRFWIYDPDCIWHHICFGIVMSLFGFFSNFVRTRYGPNRPADDMEGNGRGWFLGLRPQQPPKCLKGKIWPQIWNQKFSQRAFWLLRYLSFQTPLQPRGLNLTSDLESMVQTSYATIFVMTD